MTQSEVEGVVTAFIRENLSPKEEERSQISTRYLQLQDFFDGHTFQNGSYARFTSTTPVNDLDVIYVLPSEVVKSITVARAIDLSKLDIHRIIESLAGQLEEQYGRSATIKMQPHSVGIYFGSEEEFSIDVVPAIPTEDGMFWVPEVAHLSVGKRSVWGVDVALRFDRQSGTIRSRRTAPTAWGCRRSSRPTVSA